MTERRQDSLARSPHRLAIGPSAVRDTGDALEIEIDEISVPIPRRLRGRIRIDMPQRFEATHALDPAGRHLWRPIAPFARATVAFDGPALSWSGHAYVDMNQGARPLERDFRYWTWSRAPTRNGASLLYDVRAADGSETVLALDYGTDGTIRQGTPPPRQALPLTGWRVARDTRATADAPMVVKRTLTDAPFYGRSILVPAGRPTAPETIHECVDLRRFANPVVQRMLPFRMPRRIF